MRVTRETSVGDAFQSSAAAPAIFSSHGVRPDECCRLCWDAVSLAEAGRHCGLVGVERLIERLNQAVALEDGMAWL